MLEGMLLDTPYDLAGMSDLQRPNLLESLLAQKIIKEE